MEYLETNTERKPKEGYKNTFQMKGEEKSPEKQQNEMKARKLPETEFKALVIRTLRELVENFSSINENTETIKKNQTEMKNT